MAHYQAESTTNIPFGLTQHGAALNKHFISELNSRKKAFRLSPHIYDRGDDVAHQCSHLTGVLIFIDHILLQVICTAAQFSSCLLFSCCSGGGTSNLVKITLNWLHAKFLYRTISNRLGHSN